MRRAREACDVVVVSLFVNPAQFNDAADLDAYPRDEARDAALAAERRASTSCSPRRSTRSTRTASPPRSRVARPDRGAGGRAPRPRALRRRRRRSSTQAAQHGRPGRRLLRPEGRPAGRGRPAARRATSTSRCGSRSARPSASPTASRCPAATCLSGRAERAGALALSPRAARPPAPRSPPASATRHGREPPARAELADAGVEPEYLALVDPDTSRRCTRSTATSLVAVAARVGAASA